MSDEAYRLTILAVQAYAGSGCLRFDDLHHRYVSSVSQAVLRGFAARQLVSARKHDRGLCRRTWARHKAQISKPRRSVAEGHRV